MLQKELLKAELQREMKDAGNHEEEWVVERNRVREVDQKEQCCVEGDEELIGLVCRQEKEHPHHLKQIN